MRANAFYHERLYRSEATLDRCRDFAVTVCGAGALGSNIAEGLARQGFARLRVIDRDRIEERNLSTQPYYSTDVGASKAKILANSIYRALSVAVDARAEELTPANAARLLDASALVIDTFDNSASRRAVKERCEAASIPCLHAGLAGDYAEIIWSDLYRVPSGANDDVCDYPLARNLVLLAVAVACECAVEFVATGRRQSYTVTLRDLSIQPLEIG